MTTGLPGLPAGLPTIVLIVIGIVTFVFGLAGYILGSLAMYKAHKKAGVSNAWLAWIPIGNYFPLMNTIRLRYRQIFWLLCPVMNIIKPIMWLARFYQAFGVSRLWLLLLIGVVVPYVSGLVGIGLLVIQCIIGFSSQRQYNPNFDAPVGPPQVSA